MQSTTSAITGGDLLAARFQFPVGQGCFHAGVVGSLTATSLDHDSFHYVYDCGSRSRAPALSRAVADYRNFTKNVNALFVSHFDSDHVSGLDQLLKSVNINVAFIPYVGTTGLILDLLDKGLDSSNRSDALIEASVTPAEWFGERGVRQVVRVSASEDPDSDDHLPNDWPREDFWDFNSDLDAGVDGQAIQMAEGRGPAKLTTMKSGVKVTTKNSTIPWLFLPHVHPPQSKNLKAFNQAFCQALNIRSLANLADHQLVSKLKQPGHRKDLRACYDKLISSGAGRRHNRISMSLYSGPSEHPKEVRLCRTVGGNWGQWRAWEPCFSLSCERTSNASGWLGTGDAHLGVNHVRERWQTTYDTPYRENISTLLLPHHGAFRNFHKELLDFPNLEACVASAGLPAPYRHPAARVIRAVQCNGKTFHHVSQVHNSEMSEFVRLRY